jgi:ankyrin repeat protein
VLGKNLVQVRALLQPGTGVDVNWMPPNQAFGPVLSVAASFGPPEMVALLLEMGANPNLGGAHGMRPLFLAAREGHVQIVRLLLAGGAQVDALEAQTHSTALMIAARNGREEVVRALLEAGADPLIEDDAGLTARRIVDAREQPVIAALLRDHEKQQARRRPEGKP